MEGEEGGVVGVEGGAAGQQVVSGAAEAVVGLGAVDYDVGIDYLLVSTPTILASKMIAMMNAPQIPTAAHPA